MTNDPANIAAALRSLALYGVCALIAIIVGVLMTDPWTYSSLGIVGAICAISFIPLLLRWHHPLMIIVWNTPIYIFFLKGDPTLCLVMITVSLAISVTDRALNQRHFIQVPQITWPLCFLIGVVLITALFTGGLGLKAFGSDVYGGKKYIFLVFGILGFFAITARAIPKEKAKWYVGAFFLGGALSFIQDFFPIMPHFMEPLYLLIPPLTLDPSGIEVGSTRLVGTSWGATGVIAFLIAVYGLRGIFLSGKLWRPAVFFISIFLIFFGGFRSALISVGATIILQFFLEGLHRTKLMPFVIALTLGCAVIALPLASKLPFTFQRTLALFPESWIQLSPDARTAAQSSTEWRIEMWKGLLPTIPKYLLLGKGYAITMEEYQFMGVDSAFHSSDVSQQGLALSGDYHNGPLSVVIPFGIWGALGFLWFTAASLWVVYRNYRYGDPELAIVNTFLFTSYVVAVLNFYFIAGGFSSGMPAFTGILGLSVSINRGIRRPSTPARPQVIPFRRDNVRRYVNSPAFQHSLERNPPR
jgi:O-Antigen ligase